MSQASVLPLRLWQLGVFGLAALTGLAAGLNPFLGLALAFGTAYVLVVLSNLTAGLAIFLGLAFLESIEGLGALSLAKAAGGLLALSWVALVTMNRTEGRELPRDHPTLTLLVLLLGAWTLLSAAWADLPGVALSSAQRWILNLVMFFIVYVAVREVRHVRWIFWVFIAGALTSVAMGMVTGGGTAERLDGSGINANELGEILIIATAMAAALAAARGTTLAGRLIALGCVALCVGGLLATVSRGALVGLAVAMLVSPLLIGPGRRAYALAGVACAGVLMVLALVTFAPAADLDRLSGRTDTTGSGRTEIWKIGLRMYSANPVQGIGAGNYENTTVRYLLQPGLITRSDNIIDKPKPAHNVYLQAAAELGTIGLLLFLAIIGYVLLELLRAARRFRAAGDLDGELLARGLLIGQVGHLAALTFSTEIYNKQMWLMFAVALAMGAISRTELAQRRATPATIP